MKEVVLAWSFFQYHLSSVWIRSENDFSGAGATWYSNMSTVTQTYVSEKRTNNAMELTSIHTVFISGLFVWVALRVH